MPSPPRVLFAVRRDLEEFAGGDTVQILNTAKELRILGVEVQFTSDPAANLEGFDCLHLWHLERVHESYIFYERGKACGIPKVLSTIYWPFRDPETGPRIARIIKEQFKNAYRFTVARDRSEQRAIRHVLRTGWNTCRHRLLSGVDMLLPNSQAEADILARQTDTSSRIHVVPNGIDTGECESVLGQVSTAERHGILSVGQFDPRKNQLHLVRAVKNLDAGVTLIGAARRMHKRYYQQCRNEAGLRILFTGAMNHEDVLRHMARSRVHVCPSLAETPGLVNLEAAVMGCTLVLPDCLPVREYFADMAVYFKPGDISSLQAAIRRALGVPSSSQLRDRILSRFTWRNAATATLEAYQAVLTNGRLRGR